MFLHLVQMLLIIYEPITSLQMVSDLREKILSNTPFTGRLLILLQLVGASVLYSCKLVQGIDIKLVMTVEV